VAAGLNPVADLDISFEDAPSLPDTGATATVEILSKAVIASGAPAVQKR